MSAPLQARGGPGAPPPRRRARWRNIVVALAALGVLVWSFWIEPRRLVLHAETLALPAWPSALRGLRVAVISDLHAGGWHVDTAMLHRVVDMTNAARPDLVLLAGDYIDPAAGRPLEPEAIFSVMRELRAPLGVYAVLGNHDWWGDPKRVRHAIETAGIPVLDDTCTTVHRNGQALWICGVIDGFTHAEADPKRVIDEVPEGAPILLFTHDPDVFPSVPVRVALTVAGHTHGGQVRLPWLGSPIVPSRYGQRYAAGSVEEDGRRLFVTTGIGTSICPVRLGVPPEVALLSLETR